MSEIINGKECAEDVNLIDISALKNDRYWLTIHGAPEELSWNITGVYIPGISIGYEQLYVKDYPLNTSGDTISTEPAVIEFKISNNIKNYLYFILWMQNIIKNENEEKDIHIFITDANHQPKNIGFKLKNTLPINLSGIKFSIEEDTIDLRATVTLLIDVWHITKDGNDISNINEYILGNKTECSIENVKKELNEYLIKS